MYSIIPKRIIHIWGEGEPQLSLLSRAAVANVKLLNPDFEYSLFDDSYIESFIKEYFIEYRSLYSNFHYRIQRYDFFRYLAIYHFGGFYFDLDVFLTSHLNDLLKYNCVFPFESLTINAYLRERYNIDWQIGNYAFGATPGHPFVYKIIENCERAQRDPEWAQAAFRSIPRLFRERHYVLNTTGPGLVTRTLAENPEFAKQITILFPDNVCDPNYWNCFGRYGVHLMQGTWNIKNGILKRQLNKAWYSYTMNKMMNESFRKGETRSFDDIISI